MRMPAALWIRQRRPCKPLKDAGEHGVGIKKRTDEEKDTVCKFRQFCCEKAVFQGMVQRERIRFHTKIPETCREKKSGL